MILIFFSAAIFFTSSRSLTVNPFFRKSFLMKKQETDSTFWSSIFFKTLELSSLLYSSLGANAHHATGELSEYAIIPGGLPDTSFLNSFLLPTPLFFSKSFELNRQVIHQHPPQAPLSPKRISRSCHLSGVKGKKRN